MDYASIAQNASAALLDAGAVVTVRRPNAKFDPATMQMLPPFGEVAATYTVAAVKLPISVRELTVMANNAGVDIATARKFLISGVAITGVWFVPQPMDEIVTQEGVYVVLPGSDDLRPADTSVLIKLLAKLK